MAWLHTWGGLVVGWILYFIFLTGTLGYFDTEIDRWMQPELPVEHAPLNQLVEVAQQRLQAQAPAADRWFITLPTTRDTPNLRIFWQSKGGGENARGSEVLDSQTGLPVVARASGGGQTLYRMHYALHYLPDSSAILLVGICTMFMLVALVTGIIIHKKIFKDFFTFRPRKGQRSWLDMHNVFSVVALPFHLMITYSGLLFFALDYMPLVVAGSYGAGSENRQRFVDELFDEQKMARAGQPAQLVSLNGIATRAVAVWGEQELRYIEVHYPGDALARVSVGRHQGSPLRSSDELVFDGVSGERLADRSAMTSTAKAVRDVFLGLHEGLFAPLFLRWLYFLSGLLGTGMIATGLLLWAVKRRPQAQRGTSMVAAGFGQRLVEGLNLGTIVGLPIGIAAYFWANRLLAVDFPARAEWEVHAMFSAWLLALLYPLLRPLQRAWFELLCIAALLFAALPVLNALTTGRHLGHSLPDADWVFAGFDLTALGTGVAFAFAAWRYSRPRAARLPAKRRVAANDLNPIQSEPQ